MNQLASPFPIPTGEYQLPAEDHRLHSLGHDHSYATAAAADYRGAAAHDFYPSRELASFAVGRQPSVDASYQVQDGYSGNPYSHSSGPNHPPLPSYGFPVNAASTQQPHLSPPVNISGNSYNLASPSYATSIGCAHPSYSTVTNMRASIPSLTDRNSTDVPMSPSTSVRSNYTRQVVGNKPLTSPRTAKRDVHLPKTPGPHSVTLPHPAYATPMGLSPTSHSVYTTSYTSALPSESQNVPPPFEEQKTFGRIIYEDGTIVEPRIDCKVDKGFFLSNDHSYTCYRRNYFSVTCSYSLSPYPVGQRLDLELDGKRWRIKALAVTLTAAVDGANGKPIELVQYTPKRDQGDKLQMSMQKLWPQYSSARAGHLDAPSYALTAHFPQAYQARPVLPFQEFDDARSATSSGVTSSQGSHYHTFERVQFKSATANNGKRRAQQQFYHLNVELHADVRDHQSDKPLWKRIALRTSQPVVVRGRSPSHYQNTDPQHGSSTNRGGAGGAGAGGSGATSYGFGSAGGLLGASSSRSYAAGSSALPGTYSTLSCALPFHAEDNLSPNSSSSSHTASPVDTPLCTPLGLSAEHGAMVSKALERSSYPYRPDLLHNVVKSESQSIKDDYILSPVVSNYGAILPPATGCGKFAGLQSNRGLYATDTAQYLHS